MSPFIFKGMIVDSPLEKFIKWYMSLPVPHRQSIVEFVIFFNIGFEDIDTMVERSELTTTQH
jgi:hypothetical protein